MSQQINMDRGQQIGRLAVEEFDLLVIGGGITGACVAYDAARRGARVALLERRDFGGATSASSSKVLHGGIRFLQQVRPDKVRESAFERVYFQNLVPHLCHYVPFMIPTFSVFSKGRAALFAANVAYYLATLGQNKRARNAEHRVGRSYLIGRDRVSELVPWLAESGSVNGALMLPECHMKSTERVTWSIIHGAAVYGAVVANYVSAEKLISDDGRIVGALARDETDGSSFEVSAKMVANCSGPWMRDFPLTGDSEASNPITAYSRGSHLVLKNLDLQCAIALPTLQKIEGLAGRGGRHMFLIPWRGHTLVGTSYAPHEGSLDAVAPTGDDIDQLITGINGAVGRDLITRSDIVHAYAGIYPLIADNVASSVYQGTGEYQIIDHGDRDGLEGYISVFGAKFTTARILAEKACDLIGRKLGMPLGGCSTRYDPVPLADFGSVAGYLKRMERDYHGTADRERITDVVTGYGADAPKVLDLAGSKPELGRPIGGGRDNLAAEAVFSARNEMLVHLDDYVFRRSGIGTLGNPGRAMLQNCANLIGDTLHWSRERCKSEVDRVIDRF